MVFMFVELIYHKIRLCVIDGVALRVSKYDSEAKVCKNSLLGYFKGYKLHCILNHNIIIQKHR